MPDGRPQAVPGTIVQVIKEEPVTGMSEMRLGGVVRYL